MIRNAVLTGMLATVCVLAPSTAMAQNADPLADSDITTGAQAAFSARTNPQSSDQVIGNCLRTVQQLRIRPRAGSNLPFCAAYDTAVASIAGHDQRPGAVAIGQQTTERVRLYLAALGIPPQQVSTVAGQIAQAVTAKLRTIEAIATAPTDTYREVHGAAEAQVAHLQDGSLHVHLSTAGRGCGGGVEGSASQSGAVITMSRVDGPAPNDGCRVTLTRSGGGRMSLEEQSCSAWHGASCQFEGRYTQVR